ncbi:MAG: YbaK/EbsC family protein [Cryobacterium sp.]|nr:YbaK/EbsC family protein [Cryobacterium sp.]
MAESDFAHLQGHERVKADAAARDLDVEIVERPAANSLHEAAEIMGIRPADIVKTMVVRKKSPAPESYLLVLVPGDRQISWPKLRALVGANKLDIPDESHAIAATGYARGTVTPLGASGGLAVYADATVPGRRIALGSGEHGYSVFVDSDALIESFGAVVADLTEPAKH